MREIIAPTAVSVSRSSSEPTTSSCRLLEVRCESPAVAVAQGRAGSRGVSKVGCLAGWAGSRCRQSVDAACLPHELSPVLAAGGKEMRGQLMGGWLADQMIHLSIL